MPHKRIIVILLTLVAVVLTCIVIRETALAPKANISGQSSQTNTTSRTFNKQAYSTTDPTSIWVVVNKQHPLMPTNYVPADLVVPSIPLRSGISGDERQVSAVMAPALAALATAAQQVGVTINLQSGYRSYGFQVALYNSYVKRDGQAAADQESARAGYSEHQTGLAADVGGVTKPSCNVAQCFADTPEGQWLAIHAYEYGFIIRYTAAKQSVTGYEDEPWHIRYIGIPLATEMHNRNIQTLEEFFSISGGTTYSQP